MGVFWEVCADGDRKEDYCISDQWNSNNSDKKLVV